MISFAVSEEKNVLLSEKMRALRILESDLEEKFIRSSGKGGQKVNKTSSCVYLKHKPSGIEVKCMEDRSQSVNRFLARRELVKRIEQSLGRTSPEDLKRERIRRQKVKKEKRAARKYGS